MQREAERQEMQAAREAQAGPMETMEGTTHEKKGNRNGDQHEHENAAERAKNDESSDGAD
jgi:hypothetical protein